MMMIGLVALFALSALGHAKGVNTLNVTRTSDTLFDDTTISKITGNTFFVHNPQLTTVLLPAVETIGGHVEVFNNSALTLISIPIAKHIKSITFSENHLLQDITLASLVSVGNVKVVKASSLVAFELASLTSAQDIVFSVNEALLSVSFSSLHTARSITVSLNPNLQSASFPQLVEVLGDVVFHELYALESTSFPSLEHVDGDIIFFTDTLMELLSFPVLVAAQSLVVKGNANLVMLDTSTVHTVGTVDIQSNYALQSIDLSSVPELTGNLTIAHNFDLAAISLPNLASVTGDVVVGHNFNLPSWHANSLTKIDGSLSVTGNMALVSILLSLKSLGGDEVAVCGNGKGFVVPAEIQHLAVGKQCDLQNGTTPCTGKLSQC